ncbi:hypothetical protein FLO80_00105 [Aquicoccus porphyridii]|uniref:Uncharacterized protein n=2 Tax=Aquicoccus porphyridii TaxID=1852029 RepID=A0A5A9ZUM9_9RHOB|nr:hypothetical protein FLO80_00105 [Aquicoccus porphyridii]
MSATSIPFEIPAKFLLDHALGNVERYGAILKHVDTGRIVGHVQETGMLSHVLNVAQIVEPTGVASLIGVAQNAQVSRKLTALQSAVGTLQSLQMVNLASSVAGIGVTAASTAIIMKRLGVVNESLDRVEDMIGGLPVKLREMDLRKTLVNIQTSLDRLDGAGLRRDGDSVVKSAEEKLHYGFNSMLDGLSIVVIEKNADPALVNSLLAGLSLCGSAQIKALYWLNELEEAERQSRSQFEKLEKLSLMVPQDILETRISGGAEPAARIASDLSEVRARVASMPGLTKKIRSLDIHGRAYLERLEDEQESPLLLLPAEAGLQEDSPRTDRKWWALR